MTAGGEMEIVWVARLNCNTRHNCGGLACNIGDLPARQRYLLDAESGTDFAVKRSDRGTNGASD
jgi:hypothetical protein